jgi:hypothetical protein
VKKVNISLSVFLNHSFTKFFKRRSPRRDRWKAVHEMWFLKIVGYVLMRG